MLAIDTDAQDNLKHPALQLAISRNILRDKHQKTHSDEITCSHQ